MQTEILTGAQSKRARNELGLSQQQVADESGLSRTKLSWVEGRKYTPEDDFTRQLRSFYEGQGVDFSQDHQAPAVSGSEPGDEVNRKRQEQAQPPGRNNDYRGGLRISPELSETVVELIFDRMEKNNRRIDELRAKATGPGVGEGGFLILGDGKLQLEGEDREIAQELIQRTAANYLLVQWLQGEVTEPAKPELVKKPWQAGDHDELLRALVSPYAFGMTGDENGRKDDDEDGEDVKADQRRQTLHAVQ
jgi:transcriptional regulator with XRE-family HTH domain